MRIRRAVRAGSFYPARGESCSSLLDECIAAAPSMESDRGAFVGGIVPHAGWVYSGPTAASTFLAVGDPPPRAFVIFGAVHVSGVRRPAIDAEGAWETPIGDVPVDEELAARILEACPDLLEGDDASHKTEHSIEVQVPFVRRLFEGSAIVPIATPPTWDAVDLGEAVGRALGEVEERVVVIGSTDLTHYGPMFYGFAPKGTGFEAHRWAKEENDRSFLERLLAFDPRGALEDARANRNACGAGAAAATAAASKVMGADRAVLISHVTSYEVRAEETQPRDFVGYASIAFVQGA
ncbi:MAG: AmmeMemoRadiSam system protein B [Planctomycetota bacterium]|jgi:AmmeMemoRadiSam system protein B